MLIAGVGQHLDQVAGLAIIAQHLGADHQLDLADGELAHELLNCLYCGIIGLIHAEDDFVFGIILDAMAAEALIHLGIDAPQRLKN